MITPRQAIAELLKRKQLKEQTNYKYYPLYQNTSRYLVLKGGGGSGKSIFAGQKILKRITGEKGHRILVVRKVAKTNRESTFQQIKSQVNELYNYELFKFNETDMKITYKPNKNEIIFVGLDDVEKLKSIHNITSIWIEEASEIAEGDYRQLDIRLRGKTNYYKQIIFSFNPVSITHWLKSEFFDKKKEDTTTLHSTYKDNRFLDDEQIKVLESFADTDPYYYQVYCCGEWGVLGKTIFDAEKVSNRIIQLRNVKPVKVGYFEYKYTNQEIDKKSIEFIEDTNGFITIYEDVKKYNPYVIGGDTAGEGSDWFSGQVINNNTGKQAAVLHIDVDEDLYARQMYCLGTYYNDALISLEANYSTYPIKELLRLKYHRQYMREQEDTVTGNIKKSFGFMTTKVTRPIIIANLVKIVRESTHLFSDIKTLEEMLTFIRNENGRAEAQEGKHDDLIMGIAIAYYSREQQSYLIEVPPEEKPKYSIFDDDKEDIEGGFFD